MGATAPLTSRARQEQLHYSNLTTDDCKRWFLCARYNGHPYGGVFAFFNPEAKSHKSGTPLLFVQGICRYLTSTVAAVVEPELGLASLNSLLQPRLIELARELGAGYIYITPIGKQSSILTDHYGYKLLKYNYDKPCKGIYSNAGMGPGLLYNPFYCNYSIE